MTIKELCKKHTNCGVCPYIPICGDIPEKYSLGEDLEVTNAIIETAEALEQEPEDAISRYGVPHKIAEFFSNWDGDENSKMEISVNDMREISNMFVTKCRAESKLKALQKPCEDCISRQAAIDIASGACHPANIAKELKRLPSVQPKTGHWIPSHIPESILDECSECGFSCGAFTFNYCPMCGARMIEPQESEE